MDFSINVLPLIIGTIFNMGLGAMWYSPLLFGKQWMKESKITEDYLESSGDKMKKVYMYTALIAFTTSYVIGFLVNSTGINTIVEGLILATLIWIGTSLPTIVKNWGFEGRSVKLGIINHGYNWVVYTVVSVLYVIF